ncbi:phage tail tape measure protein [Bacillus sp. 3103sda1]|uniref:phage tail tape measure protein n=1 Tax=Bacillus sp. 3103sda1 TaxID=2953808 RepID=UPI00209DD3F4|nr:phage tail tape measure protein [Bacillus sp. 3103sda1]MCP1124559.1 phage tail tape measure protein [Bacillus sp. 3103sda1]
MSKKIKVELYSNSTEFKNDMKAVGDQMKLLRSEFQANRTAVGTWGDEFRQSEVKMDFLTKQIELQKQKVESLTKAYIDSANKKGQDAKETQNLARQLNYATSELNKMQNDLTQTSQKLDRLTEGKHLNEFKNDMSSLALAMKKIDSELKLASSSAENFGNEMRQTVLHGEALTSKLEVQQQVVNRLENEYERLVQAEGQNSREAKQLAIRLDEARASMNGLQNELTQTEQRLESLDNELRQQSTAWGRFTGNMDAVGNKMMHIGGSVAATAGVGFATMTYAMKDAVSVGMEFGAQVSRVGAIAGATTDQLNSLKNQALELGASTSKSASEIAKGQEALAALGFTVDDVLGAMPGVISAAEASGSDMAQTAGVMASTLNIFSMEASEATRVADILAKTANISAADLTDMQYALKYAGPPAASLGISLEELAASIGIMTNAGMEGEQAGTTLRTALLRLIDPPKEASTELKKLGVTATDSNGKFVGLESIVEQLSKGMNGMTDAQKAAALSTIFGTEAVSGMLSLISAGPKEIDEMTKSLENSAGASAEAAKQMKDNLAGAVDEMSGAIETAKIKFTEGLTPALEGAAKVITDLVQKWNNLDEGTQEVIATSAALATALLGVTAVVGVLTLGIGALLTFAGPLGLAIVGGTVALGALGIAGYATVASLNNVAKAQEESKEKALLYGDGVSNATVKASKSYVKMREEAELQMFQLSRTTGEEADKMATKIVETYSKMSTDVISTLETFKKDVSVVMEQLFQDTEGKFGEQRQKIEQEAINAIDKDIGKTKQALDTIKKYQQEFNLDTSKMSANQQVELQNALNVFQEMTSAFAKNQKDALAIQQSIVSENGKLSYKQAKEYNSQINNVYKEGQDAAKKDYEYRKDIISKMDVDSDTRKTLMAKNDAQYQQTLAKNTATYKQNAEALFNEMSRSGKLLDLETGNQFERLKKWDTNTKTMLNESEADYQKRWAEQQINYFQKLGESKESAMQKTQQALIEFYTGMGLTLDQAKQEASKVVNGVNEELKKSNPEAEQAGKDKGDAHKKGVESTEPGNKAAGEKVSNSTDESLGKKKEEAGNHGKEKGNKHKQGVESTAGGNKSAGDNVSNSTDSGLSQQKGNAQKHGSDKGNAHKQGVQSTQGSNGAVAQAISFVVSRVLGSTTDGGGGQKAGSMFGRGVGSQKGNAQNAGRDVAKGAESGLKSGDSYPIGSAIAKGMASGITGGRSSVISSAIDLATGAISAAKRALGINSPSRVAKYELGHWVPAGVAEGMNDNIGVVQKAANNLAKAAIPDVADIEVKTKTTSDFSSLASTIGSAAEVIKTNRETFTVHNIIQTPNLEAKLEKLLSFFEKSMQVMTNQQEQDQTTQSQGNTTIQLVVDKQILAEAVAEQIDLIQGKAINTSLFFTGGV